jgi:hypothetical protein
LEKSVSTTAKSVNIFKWVAEFTHQGPAMEWDEYSENGFRDSLIERLLTA